MLKLSLCLPVLLFVALGSSCTPYSFCQQDLYLRHTPGTDTVELLVVTVGLYVPDSRKAPSAAELLSKVEDGYRHVLVMDWPFEVDFDAPPARLESEDETTRALYAWGPNVSVVSAGLYLDEEANPCLFQHLRFEKISVLLSLIDRSINESIATDASKGDEQMMPWQDEETMKLWREHARAGRGWSRFEEGALIISVPSTEQAAARALAELFQAREGELDFMSRLLAVSSLRIADGQAELRLNPGANGWFHIPISRKGDADYDPALHDELLANGIELPVRANPDWPGQR